MKRFLLAFFIVVGSLGLKAQWVSIPDTAFANRLNVLYPQCMNGNQMDTTCPAIVNEKYGIDLFTFPSNMYDITGIVYFDSLIQLYVNNSQITTLPDLPPHLTSINCRDNQLTSIPYIPAGVTDFNCDANQLSALPPLPDGLVYLYCSSNNITSLPPLPSGLLQLRVIGNDLHVLPALPASLQSLFCASNQLDSLPALPGTLLTLYCYDNNLAALPALPNGLKYLGCGQNQLTVLPVLPDSLRQLGCDRNQITALPDLPKKLWELSCYQNQLTALPELPDSLSILYCHYNPYLTCLPKIKRINYLDFRFTAISCLPNYGIVLTSNPPLSSVPLCNSLNNNTCSEYWNISGQVYFDANSNCTKELTDVALKNVKANLWQNGSLVQQTFTGSEGVYSFDTDNTGTYRISIDTTDIVFSIYCPAAGFHNSVITTLDSTDFPLNFSLQCKPGFNLVANSIVSLPFRPAIFNRVRISAGDISNLYNARCGTGISGQVQLVISGPVSYISPDTGALAPTAVLNDTISWTIADFEAVNFLSDFNIILQADTTAQLGAQICLTLIVNPITGDNNPANNIYTHCFPVVASYDPNIKEVYPIADIDTVQEWLTYTIHFQNTGTAEAQHIYVDDTLDSDLDASSFQLLAYSHQPLAQIKQNTVRFNFPNINLPDSNTNEPLSHGYVQYKIKLKENLPVGTTINNTAFIYFDFNAPVVTNTTTNTIVTTTSISEIRSLNSEIRLYPNPTNNTLNIQTKNFNPVLVSVFDINGKKISEQKYISQIDVSALTSGIYFIELKGKDGVARKKFVKM